jgi:hypothetical protein
MDCGSSNTAAWVACVVILIVIYYVWSIGVFKTTEGFHGSAPSVVLFTKGTGGCSTCSRERQMDCSICQFKRLASYYGNIKIMHVPDVSMYADISLHVDGMLNAGGPLIVFLPEGLNNMNLVKVYKGPMNTIAMEDWIKSLPFSRA